MSAEIRAFVEVVFKAVDQLTAEVKGMKESVQELKEQIIEVKPAAEEGGAGIQKLGVSMRGVAMDLRMVSIATAIFRREFGVVNPVVDTLSRGLLILSTSATAVFASLDLMIKMGKLMAAGFTAIATAIKAALIPALTALAAHPIILAIMAIIAAIVILGTIFSPAAQATRYYQREMDTLKESIEDCETAIRNLRYEMEGLQIDQQIARIQEMQLEHAIEMRGFATEEETSMLAALKAQQYGLNLEMEKGRLTTMQTEHEMHGYENRLEDINKEISKLPSWGFAGPYGAGGGPIEPGVAAGRWAHGGQAGFVPQFIGIRASEIRTTGGLLERQIQVFLSFPGAKFASGFDIETALKEGAREAAIELRRRM